LYSNIKKVEVMMKFIMPANVAYKFVGEVLPGFYREWNFSLFHIVAQLM
jgi:hypothetical protein